MAPEGDSKAPDDGADDAGAEVAGGGVAGGGVAGALGTAEGEAAPRSTWK
ncbi:hypothetical protein LUW74_43835 [Actinomadura madurae]|nr:hypothetical protein [Actinomadura madurae]URN09607.1 hypothetical protein LUW74_43835 [Actinomadura madurae]